MKCSKCGKDGRSKVLESRHHEGCVWRRRLCPSCLHLYVTMERSGPDIKFPPRSWVKKTEAEPKPAAGNDGGAGLQAIWHSRK
jgi:transcriptional regulator NrdR family protein